MYFNEIFPWGKSVTYLFQDAALDDNQYSCLCVYRWKTEIQSVVFLCDKYGKPAVK